MMFVDVVGSTTLVATRPPMEVVNLLNRFFTVIVEEVDRHRSLLNKFEGDATLAVFGAPITLERPGRGTGCRSDHLRSAQGQVPECPARIRVAAGQVVAGNVGSRERFEYTVIGHRSASGPAQWLARSEPSLILTTERTISAASEQERRHWRLGETVQLRGYREPVRTATSGARSSGATARTQPSVAQRLGRLLERVTHQSGRLSTTPVYGSLLLGGVRETRCAKAAHPGDSVLPPADGEPDRHRRGDTAGQRGFPVPNVFTDVPSWLPFGVVRVWLSQRCVSAPGGFTLERSSNSAGPSPMSPTGPTSATHS